MHGADLTPIALILFFAFLGGFLLHRLRQPTLVGYILVGALFGPALFNGNEAAIETFASFAIVILMFMLGLELDIEKFRKAMGAALLVTALQIALGLAAMLVVAEVFAWPWQLAVLIGFAGAISSTAVAIGMLKDLKETDKPAGRLAMAILVAQDLAVVPMLLVVGALSARGVGGFELVQFGISLGVIALTLIGIFELYRHPRWVARIEKVITTGDSQPAIAGLAFAFGAAALSGYIGLSSAYGAFVMGLMIGNLGSVGASYRQAVHSIHDLLMMAFFLSVGLLLDFQFIFQHIEQIVLALAAVLVIKFVINVGILHFALSVPTRAVLIIAVSLGQVGEFAFVLVGLGLSEGFIGSEGYQIMLAIIALSLALSPILLRLTHWYMDERPMV